MEVSSRIMSDLTCYMKYARYLPSEFRRETWPELVARNKAMHLKKFPQLKEELDRAYEFVLDRKILPSMRSMQFAGKPIELNNSRLFNCSYLPMDAQEAFSELMFLLLSGCGVGFSVQRYHTNKLPEVRKPTRSRRYLVGDSIEGWSDAIKILFKAYFQGKPLPIFDFSDIRPKGAMLVTSGGKAPGPEPLKHCLDAIKTILDRQKDGGKLSSLSVHDICCLIADAVLAGGIRRSATISLFDLDDREMLTCKSDVPVTVLEVHKVGDPWVSLDVEYRGERFSLTMSRPEYEVFCVTGTLPWFRLAPYRARANNSAVIVRHKIEKDVFLDLWQIIKESNAGEPGFFMTNDAKGYGLNPCAEISLKANQFCNLVTVNVSDVNSQEEYEARVRAATFIATLQASYTNFHYLREIWKETTEKEALIGVSMTGIASGKVLRRDMEAAAKLVKEENARVAKLIGINKAARCTTVKPEGTSSLILGSSSGIHPWHSQYYMRRMRVGKNEGIYQYLAANYPELIEDEEFRPDQQAIIKIPIKAPEGAITREESALNLLHRVGEVWTKWIKPGHRKGSNINNVSATISIKKDEWKEVGEWMWENRFSYTALSVLPYDYGTYIQAPFTEITKEEYEEAFTHLKDLDLSKVLEYQDTTNLQGEVACGGSGSCEVN